MKYPFIKCLEPKNVINPYTGDKLLVPCMQCPACLMRKSAMNALKCELESLSHKYTMFVTLTYCNSALPKMTLVARNRYLDDCGEIVDTFERFRLEDSTPRLGEVGTFLGHTDAFLKVLRLSRKVELPPKILPRLSKRDAQLFMKRLRRNIDKYFNHLNYVRSTHNQEPTETPKIRYYLVGEYGPKHYRPHYHLLLWFSDDTLYKNIRQILYKSWEFGRIDCQKSQGQCANYVAKYVNCNNTLPEVFSFQQTRPFSLHSSHLGEKILEIPREEVYKMEYKEFVVRRFASISGDSDLFLWRSFKTWYFPKCKRFSSQSKYKCLYAYTTFRTASNWLGKNSTIELAREILRVCYCVLHNTAIYPNKAYLPYDKDLIEYFITSSGIQKYDFDNSELYLRSIYMELRLSKHFVEFVCGNDDSLFIGMLDRIIQFYGDEERFNINNQYQEQLDYLSESIFNDYTDLEYMYYNRGFDVDKFKMLGSYRRYREERVKKSEDSVKHKKLNDANRIFM